MKQLPISSRIIQAVYFSPEDEELQVCFRNGEVRRFAGVSQAEANALCEAESPGQHYLDHIRSRFRRVAA